MFNRKFKIIISEDKKRMVLREAHRTKNITELPYNGPESIEVAKNYARQWLVRQRKGDENIIEFTI